MAKRPTPGQVKTRLAAATSDAWAARVAEAFLLDTLGRLSQFEACRVLVFAPHGAETYFGEIVQDSFKLEPQSSGDLGERMASFFFNAFSLGAPKVVLVGCDSPTLPLHSIEQAFTELESSQAVFGPSTDGGYYLLGCSRFIPQLFKNVPWSTSQVLSSTIANLQDSDYKVGLLPCWYDVDTLADWQMLQGHLSALRRAGVDPCLPHIERLTTVGAECYDPAFQGKEEDHENTPTSD